MNHDLKALTERSKRAEKEAAPEPHDGDENTHRMCIHGAKDDGEWTFDLQINKGDGYAFYRLLKALFGFERATKKGAE